MTSCQCQGIEIQFNSREAAKKLIEAIDAGESITNDRALALAKRVASRILAASQPPSLQNRE